MYVLLILLSKSFCLISELIFCLLLLAVSCGPPPEVPHAVTMSSGQTYQSIVSYMCHPGLSLIGSQNLTCQADGKWSLPTPSCECKNT